MGDPPTPRSQLARVSTARRAKYGEGLLTMAGMRAWVEPLAALELLSPSAFSAQRGAAEAAAGDEWEAPGETDDDRDTGLALLEEIVAKDGEGDARALPPDGPELVKEFRFVASLMSNREDAVRRIDNELADEYARGVPMSAPAPAAATAATAAEGVVARQHRYFAYQNNGEAMADNLRPRDSHVETLVAAIGSGDRMTLGELAVLLPELAVPDDELPNRAEILILFREALSAAVLATCTPIGERHLARMDSDPGVDQIAAKVHGAAMKVGGKKASADNLYSAVEKTANGKTETCSKAQAARLVKRVWLTLDTALRKGRSLSVGCIDALVAASEVPPAPPAAPRKPRGAAGSGSGPGSSGSHGGRPGRSRSSRRGKGKGKKRAREESSSDSSDSGSDDSNSSSSTSSSSAVDSKYAERDAWGGAKASFFPCHQQRAGKCRRGSRCPYSHDPKVLKGKGPEKKRGKKGKKDKKDKKAKKHKK
jgi:hypothetical protein